MGDNSSNRAAGTVVAWLDQGNRLFEQKRLSRARRAYETAERLARAVGDGHGLGIALHNRAATFEAEGLRPEARRCYEEALVIQKQVARAGSLEGHWMAVGATQHQLAHIAWLDGRLDEARGHVDEALTIRFELMKRHELQFLPDTVASMGLLAGIDQAQGRLEDAAKHLEGAIRGRRTLAALHAVQHLPELANTLDLLSAVLASLGRTEEAGVHAKEAASIRAQLATGGFTSTVRSGSAPAGLVH
jgi:tetratricopeptide (TPR) repeat protein